MLGTGWAELIFSLAKSGRIKSRGADRMLTHHVAQARRASQAGGAAGRAWGGKRCRLSSWVFDRLHGWREHSITPMTPSPGNGYLLIDISNSFTKFAHASPASLRQRLAASAPPALPRPLSTAWPARARKSCSPPSSRKKRPWPSRRLRSREHRARPGAGEQQDQARHRDRLSEAAPPSAATGSPMPPPWASSTAAPPWSSISGRR